MPGMGEYGHEMELEIAVLFEDNKEIAQSGYEILSESISTNDKLVIGGGMFSETDTTVSLERAGLKNWFKRKPKIIDVDLQSKRYSEKVGLEKVLHDLVKRRLTYDIGKSLSKRTFALAKEADPDLELMLWRDHNVRTIYKDDLAKHMVVEKVGVNSFRRTPLRTNEPEEIGLGYLYLLDTGLLNKLNLFNFIEADKINQSAFDKIVKAVEAPKKYLSPEIYLYVSTKGISKDALIWLNLVNAYGTLPDSDYPLTVNHLRAIVSQGDLLSYFKKLKFNPNKTTIFNRKYKPFGFGNIAIGQEQSTIYGELNDYIKEYDNRLVNFFTLKAAVNRFLGLN